MPLPQPEFKRRRQTRKVWIPQQRDATRARTGGKDAAEGRHIFDEVNSMVLSYIRGLDPAQCTEQEVQQHYLECEHEAVETEEDMGHLVKVVTSCVAELVKAGELVVITESPHPDEPELRILAPRAAADRGPGAFQCPVLGCARTFTAGNQLRFHYESEHAVHDPTKTTFETHVCPLWTLLSHGYPLVGPRVRRHLRGPRAAGPWT